jgi:hypothetical protein
MMIATHNYHNDYLKLPPGIYGQATAGLVLSNSGRGNLPQYVGIIFPLLPYMEQDNLFKGFDIRNLAITGGDINWWNLTLNYNLATARMKMMNCPSDTLYDPVPNQAAGQGYFLYYQYYAGVISAFVRNTTADALLGRSNYAPCAGFGGNDAPATAVPNPMALSIPQVPTKAAYEGIFGNRTDLTLGQLTVQDGTSNTLGIGELLGSNGMGLRQTAMPWLGLGPIGTAGGLGKGNVSRINAPGPGFGPPCNAGDPSCQNVQRFSSRHAAVVQFAWGDGSTRGVRFASTWVDVNTALTVPATASRDWQLLQQLAGRKDGYNSDVSGLID